MKSRKYALLGIVSVLSLPTATIGQQLIRGGNALDANPQRGSGGFNPTGRQYDPNAANRIITGNVSGGRAFQGYSPIRDSSSLFLGSPNYNSYSATSGGLLRNRGESVSGFSADSLSTFYRDSYSYGDNRDPYAPAWQSGSYYSSPAYTTGTSPYAQQGQNRVGSSRLGGTNQSSRSGRLYGSTTADPLVAARQSLQDEYASSQVPDVYQNSTGRINADQMLRNAAQEQAGADGTGPRPITTMLDTRVQSAAPGDAQRGGSRYPSATPAARAEPTESMLDRGRRLESRLIVPRKGPATGREEGVRSAESDAAVQAFEATQGSPEAGSAQPATPLLSAPKTTVAPKMMAQAVKSLKEAKYYQAASQFEMAEMAEIAEKAVGPRSPSPSLGRSMALLGAGDYLSSAASLFVAARLLNDQPSVQVNLVGFAREVKNANDRIVELKGRLERDDDYRLRFLLGYAEYAVGLTDLGMGHMDRAITMRTQELAATGSTTESRPAAATRPASGSQITDLELQCLVRFVDRLKSPPPSLEAKPATQPAMK